MRGFRRAAFAILLLAGTLAAQTIRLDGGAFRVEGWSPPKAPQDWASIFRVYAGGKDVPPLLGKYAIEAGSLVFRPRFPITAGLRYLAVFHAPGGSAQEVWIDGPKRSAPSARVTQIYPSADVLPSNTLKLYVVFSSSMSRGDAWKHIHVLDENGKEIELPFLVIEQELWDPSNRRLTLLFDPGRIKRGLVLNESIGPPIVEGRHYTLAIDRDWLDAAGIPMVEGFRKTFRGGPADRTPPYMKDWRVAAPRADTADPLIVDFPKAMDYGLVQDSIEVPGVSGTVKIGREETRWEFTPGQPWKPGKYQLVVDSRLEDVAGNQVDRPFDVDLVKTGQQRFPERRIPLAFEVR